MEIRTIEESEFDEFLKMGEFAFQYVLSEENKEKRKQFFDLDTCWAAFIEGKMASKLTVHPMEMWLGDQAITIGGIAGVATWPEFRRKGYIQQLMKKSLEVMKENGQSVSMLHPFSFSFYRKYGWEMTHSIKRYEFSPRDIGPAVSIRGNVFRINHDIDRLDQMYTTFAKQFSGMLKRSRAWWKYSVLSDPYEVVAVYQNEIDEDKGYMIYHVKDDTMTIEEMVVLDDDARKAFMRFMKNHDSMVSKILLEAPERDDLAYDLDNPKIKQEIKSYFMSRIVDVEAILRMYPFRTRVGDPIIFHVEDHFAQWNNGIFIVKDKNGKRIVEKHEFKKGMNCQHPPQRGLLCDINTLSALLLHYQRPDTLWRKRRLTGNEEEINRLEDLIRPEQTFLYDFF